ncbi:hypothetical protein DMENIID0001_037130 [Sergentomyia squamirostris]
MINCAHGFSLFLALIMCYCVSGFPINATVDQRQTGKYNIQFNIKDVAIIFQKDSIWGTNVGDDISYDYDYDYDHLTVKPDSWGVFNGTKPSKPPIYITSTKPPTNSSSKPPGSSGTVGGSVTILSPPPKPVNDPQPVKPEPSSIQNSTDAEKTTTTATFKYPWNGDLEKIPVTVIVDPSVAGKGRRPAPTRRRLIHQERPLNSGL